MPVFRAHRALLLAASFTSSPLIFGCDGGEKASSNGEPARPSTPPPKDEAKEPTKIVDDTPAPKPAAPNAIPAAGGEGAGEPEGVGAEGAVADEDAGAADGAALEGADGEAQNVDRGKPPVEEKSKGDAASLIKEARTTKTTDERALEALAEAEEAGATAKELARAAKARGDYLYKAPERARVFYEWSAERDETYPDPVFRLAKQKAVTGDIDDVVTLLKQVAERKGGKKLLEQIDFDPTWDIVKDDPEVRALL